MTTRDRDFQAECKQAVLQDFQSGFDSTLFELPTGCGKTHIAVSIAKEFQGRVLFVLPQLTLIGQTSDKFFAETGLRPDIEQGDLYSNETPWGRSQFVVGSKQSLCSAGTKNNPKPPRYSRMRDIDLVIFDECHYCVTKPYYELWEYFRCRGAKGLGMSATVKRHDKRAQGQLFQNTSFQRGMLDMIEDGWLVKPMVTTRRIESLDLSEVESGTSPIYGRDFNNKQLQTALEDDRVLYEIAAATADATRGKKTVIYCASVLEARDVANLLKDNHGINADWICADEKLCTKRRRHEVLRSFTKEEEGITHVCNVGILTTGWDFPGLQCIVMARPTRSRPLYTQILGRGTRPLPGVVDFEGSTAESRVQRIAESRKPFFEVIDLVDNSTNHKIITAADVLCGKWTLGAERATEKSKDEPTDIIEASKRAQEDIEREEEERKRLEAQRRAELARREAKASFRDEQVNPFAGHIGNGSKSSPYRLPATRKQLRLLWAKGFKDVDKYVIGKEQAKRLIRQFLEGKSADEVKRTNRLDRRDDFPRPAAKPSRKTESDDEIFAALRKPATKKQKPLPQREEVLPSMQDIFDALRD